MFRLIFRWLAIPWIQKELDAYKFRVNTSARRADRKKVLPSGIPDVIFENPGKYDAVEFMVRARPPIALLDVIVPSPLILK